MSDPLATPSGTGEPLQEVRVAMALNGGVSLAVWMGGCAVELDRARRADEPGEEKSRVYDALCRCLGRRLVIDILTGASAGGINGALLSAAMVSQRKLDVEFVRDRWLALGNLSDLLYPTEKEDPQALMNGQVFHDSLLEAFEEVLGVKVSDADPCRPKGRPPRRVVPSLDVTMTDVIGVEKNFKDAWGGNLVAREHRPRFKFREGVHFEARALADAARTSASFPVAFEPWRVHGDARALAGLPRETYGIDGGLLDNAPIEAALALISSKPASSRVLRYVCYLNGDPALPREEEAVTQPSLGEVGAYIVNLPRVAPFVDQLYAIKRSVERTAHTRTVQLSLLTMELECLWRVAEGLFPAYVERRTLQSLEEILEDPGEATTTMRMLATAEGRLPWIPFSLEPPERNTWHWGVRPAQRILHLLLDLIRPLILKAPDELRAKLIVARQTVDDQLAGLGKAHEEITMRESENDPSSVTWEPPLEKLERAAAKAAALASDIYEAVVASARAVHAVVREGSELESDPVVEGVFGRLGDEAWLGVFFRRVLAVEVVRRSFSAEADVESAEKLHFVQLTPAAPSPIFTAGPLTLASPASAAEKLAGIGMGHFAGFYRRSWRANDFMWGRLDAAARIVDLLLDRPFPDDSAAPAPQAQRAREHAICLADALLPGDVEEDDPLVWLARETLANAEAVGCSPSPPEDLTAIRRLVAERIEAELTPATSDTGVNKMPFTRAMFQRAAQLEVLEKELAVVSRESIKDRALGSAAEPFAPGTDAGLQAQIEGVRRLYERGETLPSRLTDDDEVVSDLGLRTITHATFVGLSALRTAGAPLSKFFGVVRIPLSAVAATVSKGRWPRVVAGLGFWAAATYLTSRLLSTAPDQSPGFSEAWTWAMLTALVAALGIVGLVAVPVLRLWRGVHPVINVLTGLALAGTAFGFAVALAAIFGSFDLERIIFAPGATNPPEWVVLAPLVALGLLSASRLPLPSWLNIAVERLRGIKASWVLSLLLPGVAFALVVFSTMGTLWDAGFDGGATWQAVSAALAIFATPLAAAVSLTRWRRGPG